MPINPLDIVKREVDKQYKENFGKMLASLLHAYRGIDLETAEDILHDTFSTALTDWRQKGVPTNASGWLFTVCRNKVLNKFKKDRRFESLSETAAFAGVEDKFSESALQDKQLILLFACGHPDLAPKVQVAITLKYVVNLRAEAIAKMLGMTIDGVDKLLLRARQKIKDEKILLEEPHVSALKPRLPIVHKIIYLTFNEGYKSSEKEEILKEELCEEAILLNKALLKSDMGNKDTLALHSLMLFNIARFKARFTASGELLDLESQDRSLWNSDLILLACDFLERSRQENLSTFHLEASIACLHCLAKEFALTDWKTIANLYSSLLQNNSNPFIELNFAIALYYSGEKRHAFEILQTLQRHPFMCRYYLLNVTLGKFTRMEGDAFKADQYLLLALEQTNSQQEKNFIKNMIGKQ